MFVVRYSNKVLCLFTFLMLALLALCLFIVSTIDTSTEIWCIFICLFFLLIYVIGIVDFCCFKIIVDNEQIIVRKTFRKKRKYSFIDIKDYNYCDLRDTLFVNFKDGKSVFSSKICKNHKLFVKMICQTKKK